MELKTNIAITHEDVTKNPVGGTRKGVVKMFIDGFSHTKAEGIEVSFRYVDDLGAVLHSVKYPNGVFKVAPIDVKALSKSINSSLPTGEDAEDNIEDRIWQEIEIIAKTEMSSTFGINISVINKV